MARPVPLRVGSLPADVTSFVGRRRETADVRRLLSAARLVTLTGVGGVGKTRLALRVLQESSRAFADGVWFVELAEVADPELVVPVVAAALGVPERSGGDRLACARDFLSSRSALIAIDNCEQVVQGCARLAAELLRSCPGVRILTTSRQPLNVAGEHLFTVPPMSVPADARAARADDLHEVSEAVELFAARAVAVVPEFRISDANRDSVVAVCRTLEGIPLAIELAAARLRVLSLDQIADQLQDRYGLLSSGPSTTAPRQRTLRNLVDWSYVLCSPDEQALWQRLAILGPGFDLAAVEGVCWDAREQGTVALEPLTGLVEKSIVLVDPHTTPARYRMLDTIRDYGRDRLLASGAFTALAGRHVEYYQRLVLEFEDQRFHSYPSAWLDRLRDDQSNLRTSMEYALGPLAPGGADVALRMAGALWMHWTNTGNYAEARYWLDRALSYSTASPVARARALWVDAYLALVQTDFAAADLLRKQARRSAETAHDSTSLAFTTQLDGMAALLKGNAEAAVVALGDAVVQHRANGHELGVADTLFYQISATSMAGMHDRAAELCRESLALCRATGDPWLEAWSLWAWGMAAWRRGERAAAQEPVCQSLRIMRDHDDRTGIALCVEVLSWTESTRGRHERAARLLGAAEQVWESLRTPLWFDLAAHHDACVAASREALGAARFDAALERGKDFDLRSAIEYALGEPSPADAGGAPRDGGPPHKLTRREKEIAILVSEGMSNREIAEALTISVRTAESHVEHILTKFGFTSRAQVAVWMASAARADPGKQS